MIICMIINFYRNIHVTEWAYFSRTNKKFSDKYSSKNIHIQNWLLYCYYIGKYMTVWIHAEWCSSSFLLRNEMTLESLDGREDLVTNITCPDSVTILI